MRAGPFELTGPEARHALVRRTRPGEHLVLTDGAGRWAVADVVGVERNVVRLAVREPTAQAVPAPRVVLVQAIPKGERAELAVDLATEAGVDEIVPWAAERCVARWTADKAPRALERWRSAAREAAKQARRVRMPVVRELADSAAVSRLIVGSARALLLHEDATTPLARLDLPVHGALLLVVGPEGGISPAELEVFSAAGATAVRLGPQVLRTSTAAAVALGAIGVLTGRWGVASVAAQTVQEDQ